MKLAFNRQARYTDFSDGYSLYVRRSKKGMSVGSRTYNRIVKRFCELLSVKLYENGIVDLPSNMGAIAAAILTRKPQYRGDKFIGFGKMDWAKGHYDGSLKAFGVVYLPKHDKNQNLRGYGFVANRRLFTNIKEKYMNGDCAWQPVMFKDEMI